MSLDQLTSEEIETVKGALQGLIRSLRSRKPAGGPSGLIPDEEHVLESLTHPERGDSLVLVSRQPKNHLELFISNRRDSENPFAIMNQEQARRNTGRRQLNHNPAGLKEGEWGLFINSIQDREFLRTNPAIQVYSSHFGLGEGAVLPITPTTTEHTASKPPSQLSLTEKWALYKRGLEPTPAGQAIEKDLFGFPVTYARYKSTRREEVVVLNPKKLKQNVGQMIRDIYPYNMRVVLRREYPVEHAARLEDIRVALKSLTGEVRARIAVSLDQEEYRNSLNETLLYLEDIPVSDPEFANFL